MSERNTKVKITSGSTNIAIAVRTCKDVLLQGQQYMITVLKKQGCIGHLQFP